MIGSSDVLRVLGLWGPIAWSRILLGVDERDGLCYPPLIVWRYVDATDAAREDIGGVVRDFRGSVEWATELDRRNWVILPAKLQARFQGAAPTSHDVVPDFKHRDQDFCVLATQELETILESLRSRVGRP